MTERWNSVLRGGPRDGMLMEIYDGTQRVVVGYRQEGGGEYRRTGEVDEGRSVFEWVPTAVLINTPLGEVEVKP